MASIRPGLILARYISSKSTLAVVALAAAILAGIISPATHGGGIAANPAAEAQETYVSLLARLGARGTELIDSTTGSPDSLHAQEEVASVPHLGRNLFASASGTGGVYSSTPTPRNHVDHGMPRLTGVFIDGYSKQVMIDGSIVKEGDVVGGYLVIEISSTWVIVEKDGITRKLVLGGNP